jgi:hypothetical protein
LDNDSSVIAMSVSLPGLNGCPEPIQEYYRKMGLPGKVVSNKERGNEFIVISLLFQDCPNRHRWCDDPQHSTKYSRWRSDGWVLVILGK